MCPVNPVLAPVPATAAGTGPRPLVVNADRASTNKRGVSLYQGHVVATQGTQRLWADLLEYDQQTHILSGNGHLRYASPNIDMAADRASYDFLNDRGIFYDNRYQLPARHGRGKAKRIDTYASDKTKLYGITYTTCPPAKPAWSLHAKRVVLNHDQEVGYAYDAWVSFKGVPLLWTPYLSFPLTNRRKSGFLAPSLSQNSSGGLDLEVPYYFNLAPNMDMTLTPRIVSRRGLMLMDTYRWLLPGTLGRFHVEYMPHDRSADRSRGLFEFNDGSQIASHWRVDSTIQYISDSNYLDDFGTSLRQVAQTYQTRSVTATYQVPAGAAFLRVEDYAPLDPSITPQERPYRKLPELGFDFSWPDYRNGLTPSLYEDFTRFEAPQRQGALRNDLRPTLKWRLGGGSWYLTPALAYDQANYRLNAYSGTAQQNINRSTPIVSFDSGLRFERTLGKGGWLTQTLEPRLFYLYVPYRDQSNIPIFDTYLPPLDMERLFADNRFVGPDRLGDANQFSLGITTRFLDNETGRQLLSLGLGQSFYLENRRVTLPGQPVETSARSDYVGQLTASLGHHLFARVVGDYNPYTHDFDQGYLSFQYKPGTYQVFNLGYLYRRGELDQTDVSFSWPIAGGWSVVGRWNYSVHDHQTLETMAGLQYESCCWRLRLVGRRFVTLNGQGNSAIFLELELKGLGSLGNRLSNFLHDDIYGYGKNSTP